MGMAEIQFYKNNYYYPKYSNTITAYGLPLPCTPVGLNLRSGTLRVKGDMTDFMSCNYLKLARDNQTLYAWIDDVKFLTEESFEVAYNVDAWRTYKTKIDLGVQFISRRPESTYLPDNLLGSSIKPPDIITTHHTIGAYGNRVFVVQVRPAVGDGLSRSPVQPTPYQFYMVEYSINNWMQTPPLFNLINKLTLGVETLNIVTMYSIPWIDTSVLPDSATGLPVTTPDTTDYITGWKFMSSSVDMGTVLYNEEPLTFEGVNKDELMRVNHTTQVIIPEAGILHVPDDILVLPDLKLRQDIDLFSGACNYMLKSGTTYFGQSVRGSSVSSIPVVSDPMDTYLSQNQNSLAVALMGDVAMIAGGVAITGMTGGAAAAGGAVTAITGVNNIVKRNASISDIGNKNVNPPAFLGTALAPNFNGKFWTQVTKQKVDNANLVHTNFGYAYDKIDNLVFPESGYIKTEGCVVHSTDGSVPRWALEEINTMFNNGVLVY